MSQVSDRELRTFFTYVIQVLEKNDIPYMVVGGFAAVFYGEPRFTIDVDSDAMGGLKFRCDPARCKRRGYVGRI